MVSRRKSTKTAEPKKRPLADAKRYAIMDLLSQGTSYPKVAEKVGCSVASIRYLMEEQPFRDELERTITTRIDAGRRAIATLIPQAAAAYQEVLLTKKGEVPPAALPALLGRKTDVADAIFDRIGIVRSSTTKVEQTSRTLNVDATPADFVGRSPQDLLFYGANGYWPEESPVPAGSAKPAP